MQNTVARVIERMSPAGAFRYILAALIGVAALAVHDLLLGDFGQNGPRAVLALAAVAVPLLAGPGPTVMLVLGTLVHDWFAFSIEQQPLDLTLQHLVSITVICIGISGLVLVLRAALVAQMKAREEALMLSREMHHRIKNLCAVILSIVNVTARQLDRQDYAFIDLANRLQALARAHSIPLSQDDEEIGLAALLGRILEPFVDAADNRITLSGQDVQLCNNHITPVALILHELATNAAKYGALSSSKGRLSLEWTMVRASHGATRVLMTWRETQIGITQDPFVRPRRGFGTQIVNATLKQIDGEIHRSWSDTSMTAMLAFSLR